ncbi:MAG TPA: pirin family protein [Steroidobacteraceae bacterium]|jgi:hypothetical protein
MKPEQRIDTVIVPPVHDLGDGFQVRRALPNRQCAMVGPFVFFDQMGPVQLRPGTGLDVRPHPHIGLATVTYLFDGEIVHRDSLGTVQSIRPGAINWMVAGRGIVHSERSPPDARSQGASLSGLQIWVALPRAQEECAPSFEHYPSAQLPLLDAEGKIIRILAGSLYGAHSPVATQSELFYADVVLRPGAQLPVTTEHEQRALYVLDGRIEVDQQPFASGQFLVLRQRQPVTVRAPSAAHVLLLGGARLDGPRHVWWNLVSSSRERIEQAKLDWRDGRLGQVPGDEEFMPLPTDSAVQSRPVDYP